VVERHGRSRRVGHGLLRDFNLKSGAVASSIGHDAHNIILAGTNEADMRVALEALKKCQGGVVVVDGGKVVAMLELPIAGLLSDKPARAVQSETIALKRAWEALGCTLPYMGFNLIPLSVIPEIRITDMGLVHPTTLSLMPLFE
jgi:adenine deaminase